MKLARDSVRCVIVDDHEILLDLLTAAVEAIPGVTVAATGTDVADAERLAALEQVDLLVVDRKLKTGGGVEVVRQMLARHPGLKCILIAGATADFVCPADLLDVVVSVIDKAHASQTLLTEIARVGNLPERAAGESLQAREIRARLTDRERQLFAAIGDGLSNKELAKLFGISSRTVETHRKAISKKLGLSGAALVRIAVLKRHANAISSRPVDHSPSSTVPEDRDA
jgi:DNA-binding NarL/FixJ family response regulator